MNDVILAEDDVLGVALLATITVTDWVAILSQLPGRDNLRHEGCGHLRAIRTATSDRCWRCRHPRLGHALAGQATAVR